MKLPHSLTLLFLVVLACLPARAADKIVLLIAGAPSHGPGQHEHNAGVQLLAKCLAGTPGLTTRTVLNGWPADEAAAFAGVDAVILFCDGGLGHMALRDERLKTLGAALAARGAGLGLIHYAVEPTLAKGQREFVAWTGGAFEINWSVNPTWVANFAKIPVHPVTRGVQPFALRDEWYFNMRFAAGMKGVTPLLLAVPTTAETMTRPAGPHEGSPAVRALVAQGAPQTMAWAFERADGGRGFGFTGAHYHANWGNENFRRLVLNAIVWLAKLEVPAAGVSSVVTEADLAANLDPKPAKKP